MYFSKKMNEMDLISKLLKRTKQHKGFTFLIILTLVPSLAVADNGTIFLYGYIVAVLMHLAFFVPLCIFLAFIFNKLIQRFGRPQPMHKRWVVFFALVGVGMNMLIDEVFHFQAYFFGNSSLSLLFSLLFPLSFITLGLFVGYRITPKKSEN